MGWQGFTWYRGSVQGLTGGAQVDDRENFGDDREREGIFIRTGFFRVSSVNNTRHLNFFSTGSILLQCPVIILFSECY